MKKGLIICFIVLVVLATALDIYFMINFANTPIGELPVWVAWLFM